MKEDNEILKRIGHNDGMTVPEGYFADFAQRMSAALPSTEFEESQHPAHIFKPRTTWQRIRPYVYMAAMFAGIWCMMKLFSALTASQSAFEPSPTLAEALDNEIFVNDYIIDDVDDWQLMDEMMDEGFDFTTLADSIGDVEFPAAQDSSYVDI